MMKKTQVSVVLLSLVLVTSACGPAQDHVVYDQNPDLPSTPQGQTASPKLPGRGVEEITPEPYLTAEVSKTAEAQSQDLAPAQTPPVVTQDESNAADAVPPVLVLVEEAPAQGVYAQIRRIQAGAVQWSGYLVCQSTDAANRAVCAGWSSLTHAQDYLTAKFPGPASSFEILVTDTQSRVSRCLGACSSRWKRFSLTQALSADSASSGVTPFGSPPTHDSPGFELD